MTIKTLPWPIAGVLDPPWTGGRIPLITGIGATLGLNPDGTLEQVLIARKRNAAGFILFDYQPRLAEKHLPFLHLGATSKR